MAFSSRSYARSYLPSDRLPPGIKGLLIANGAIFLILFFGRSSAAPLLSYFGLYPAAVVKSFFIWQLATYSFLHVGVWGILWNMLALWMFGCELEQTWGTQRFLRFYVLTGAGAGLCAVLASYAFGNPTSPILGSYGAIYALLAASAALWPDRTVLFSFLFPMQMKYFVLLIAGIDFLISYNGDPGQAALLTGLVFGLLYVKSPRLRGFDPIAPVQASYRAWKLKRAKRKFQVYLRKQRSDQDRWVN